MVGPRQQNVPAHRMSLHIIWSCSTECPCTYYGLTTQNGIAHRMALAKGMSLHIIFPCNTEWPCHTDLPSTQNGPEQRTSSLHIVWPCNTELLCTQNGTAKRMVLHTEWPFNTEWTCNTDCPCTQNVAANRIGQQQYTRKDFIPAIHDPFKLCKNSFSKFFSFQCSRGFFTHFQKQILKNLAKLGSWLTLHNCVILCLLAVNYDPATTDLIFIRVKIYPGPGEGGSLLIF